MSHALAQTLLTTIADLPLSYLSSLLSLLIQILLMFTEILVFLTRLGTMTIVCYYTSLAVASIFDLGT